MATPIQAALPVYPTIGDEIRNINRAQRSAIDPPRIIALSGGSDLVFDARKNSLLGDNKVVARLTLHNLGANPMFYAVNQVVNTGIGQFHDILAGGSVVKDGLGSQVDLSKDQADYVTVKGTAGEWVAIIISYPLGSLQNR